MTIGKNIKILRDIRGMTQKELAELIGVPAGTLSHIEKGTRQPSIDMLYAIADALSVSVINLVLEEKEVERFLYNEIIQAYYPGSARLKELLDQFIENNISWDNAKRIAIVELGDTGKPKK